MRTTVLVVGATGTTGAAVIDELRRFPDLSVRTATRAAAAPTDLEHHVFDWFDDDTWRPTLDGADRLFLLAPIGHPDPVTVVGPFAELAMASGVRRVVMLSSSAVACGDAGLGAVDALVRSTFPEWEILRPSWFMQNFVGNHPLAESIRATGEFITATGDGKLAFIDAGDIGRCAAALLAAPGSTIDEHVLTGPQALSYDEAAAVMSNVTGRRVTHRAVAPERYIDRLVGAGYDAEFAAGLVALDGLVRDGAQSRVTDAVERLTGNAPRSFEDFLRSRRGPS
ncbi:NmrA family NAD(P)-binding protein [Mycolicibacterium holsaticum]|uniref:NmrA family NAD(P)-binding protein n=1 Tax=Mycolicibacterium holsaticum TaxID=152142 RepID=UPI001C7D82D6|nr:NmrA family NAD(P)-binding protein [Mycolicibacterium holsaticum]MDA4107180.1 oxidoreductase [Mycolicibacterium holsaticum DSM 44478 = JCM 12374]QZA15014.1 NAD(P)H-binding protein [Mycolicibacterium holsaticum DSM 44478 = JCM 12374]UNC07549.1 NAD(P)H-binding protein [Mycolicibacterium holsaticum DSM 44478 = JCM 12374]